MTEFILLFSWNKKGHKMIMWFFFTNFTDSICSVTIFVTFSWLIALSRYQWRRFSENLVYYYDPVQKLEENIWMFLNWLEVSKMLNNNGLWYLEWHCSIDLDHSGILAYNSNNVIVYIHETQHSTIKICQITNRSQ